MPLIYVSDWEDERLDAYARLTEVQLRSRLEPERALFVAESPKVIDRALAAGREPLSLLVERPWLEGMADTFAFIDAHWGPDVPVFVGVGGGTTNGPRSVRLAAYAEHQGAFGVVVNAPLADETIHQIKGIVDIPVIATVVSAKMDVARRITFGADILNVSGAAETPAIVRSIREKFPLIPIIATGGPTEETILATIEAGANAITYTPPTNGELFAESMRKYRASYTD